MTEIQAQITNGRLSLPGISSSEIRLISRAQIKIPAISQTILARVDIIAEDFSKLFRGDKKFIILESFKQFGEMLGSTDISIPELKNTELMGALIYRLHYKKDTGCVRGLMSQISNSCESNIESAVAIRSAIVRSAIQVDHGGDITVQDLEESKMFTSFIERHYLNNLLISGSPAEIIEAAFPGSMSGHDAILRSENFRSGWAEGLQISKRERVLDAVARLLIEHGAVVDEKGKFVLKPEKFRSTNWSSVIKAKMLGTEIGSDPEFKGDNFLVLEAAASRLGLSEIFGIKEGQVPYWYLRQDGLWKRKFNDVQVITLFGRYVVDKLTKSGEYNETSGLGKNKLNVEKISKLNWGTIFNNEHSGATKGAGVSPVELLKTVHPELFGTEPGQMLPAEFKSFSDRGFPEVRACLAIQLYRSGLGEIYDTGTTKYLRIRLKHLDHWIPPDDFGVNWVKPYRGNLRAISTENVKGGITVTFSPTWHIDESLTFREKLIAILKDKKEVSILLTGI